MLPLLLPPKNRTLAEIGENVEHEGKAHTSRGAWNWVKNIDLIVNELENGKRTLQNDWIYYNYEKCLKFEEICIHSEWTCKNTQVQNVWISEVFRVEASNVIKPHTIFSH